MVAPTSLAGGVTIAAAATLLMLTPQGATAAPAGPETRANSNANIQARSPQRKVASDAPDLFSYHQAKPGYRGFGHRNSDWLSAKVPNEVMQKLRPHRYTTYKKPIPYDSYDGGPTDKKVKRELPPVLPEELPEAEAETPVNAAEDGEEVEAATEGDVTPFTNPTINVAEPQKIDAPYLRDFLIDSDFYGPIGQTIEDHPEYEQYADLLEDMYRADEEWEESQRQRLETETGHDSTSSSEETEGDVNQNFLLLPDNQKLGDIHIYGHPGQLEKGPDYYAEALKTIEPQYKGALPWITLAKEKEPRATAVPPVLPTVTEGVVSVEAKATATSPVLDSN